MSSSQTYKVFNLKLWKSAHIIFWILFILICIVHVLNISRLDVYPFTDLPNHLAEVTIFKFMDDLGNDFSSYYRSEIGLLKPNSFHIVFCALFRNIEIGNKLFHLLYILLVPICLCIMIRSIGGNLWFALLSFLFLYNYNIMWGFTGFAFAIPISFIAIIILFSYRNRPTLLNGFLLAFILLVLYYTHVLVFLFSISVVVIAILTSSRGPLILRLFRLVPVIPSTAIFLGWIFSGYEFHTQTSTLDFLKSYYYKEYFTSIPQRFKHFFWQDNARVATGKIGQYIGLLISLTVLCPVLAIATPKNIASYLNNRKRRIILIFVFIAILFYVFLPDKLPGQSHLYQRFSVFVYLSIVCVSSFIKKYKRRLLISAYISIICVTHSLLWSSYYSDFKVKISCFNRDLFKTDHRLTVMVCSQVAKLAR